MRPWPDLRQPGVHLQAGLSPRYGLLDYLVDPAQTDVAGAFFSRDPLSPLSLVLGAAPSVRPTDQLAHLRGGLAGCAPQL